MTQDARFSLELVECLAACGGAPVVRINETYHENVTPEAFDTLIDDLKRSAESEVAP